MTRADFEQVMAVNFWGTVNATMAVLPGMRLRGGGRIVNITSIGGEIAIPHLLAYDCAKFATVGFSEGLRAELLREGVLVTTIVPGLMRTGSPVRATFKGDAPKEAAWFGAGDATPLTAISARRAARRIVRALERGEAFVTLSWQAKLARVVHALFPGATANLLGLVNRALPESNGRHDGVEGRDALAGQSFVKSLLARAAVAYHQSPA
jgi:short-subunit dehydrogenase